MLISFSQMLKTAHETGYAVGSFNVYNYETMRGACEAAKELNMPLIVSFGAKYLENMTLQEAVSMARTLSKVMGFDFCLHLDHCSNMDTVYAAIRAGFSSVMYDGSMLPFEENLANTAAVCRVAHACGVSVEAELGSLAATDTSHEGSASDREVYTDPELAERFVKKTGVDALAGSGGTGHGLYKGTPKIRQDILKDINAKTGIPLVMHGGSGIPEEMIKESIRNGISKINVNTEIATYTVAKTAELISGEKKPHLAVVACKQQVWVKEVVQKYMRFFAL